MSKYVIRGSITYAFNENIFWILGWDNKLVIFKNKSI